MILSPHKCERRKSIKTENSENGLDTFNVHCINLLICKLCIRGM